MKTYILLFDQDYQQQEQFQEVVQADSLEECLNLSLKMHQEDGDYDSMEDLKECLGTVLELDGDTVNKYSDQIYIFKEGWVSTNFEMPPDDTYKILT